MSLNRLLLLHETLLESADSTTIGTKFPVKPLNPQVPIHAIKQWQRNEKFLYKEYQFTSTDLRNRFVNSLLSYEEEKGHNGQILIDGLKIKIKVTTKSVNKVTELDNEYARSLDQIEKEIKLSGK